MTALEVLGTTIPGGLGRAGIQVSPPAVLSTSAKAATVRSMISLYLANRNLGFPFAEAVTAGTVDRTIEGASTVKLTCRDPDLVLLNSGLFDYTIDANIEDMWFRLVAIEKAGQDLNLTFEDRAVWYLRGHNKPRRLLRSKGTRAQFIQMLVKEVTTNPIGFWAPQLTTPQQIGSKPVSKNAPETSHKLSTSAGLKIGGVTATQAQLNEVTKCLRIAFKKPKITRRAIMAMLVAGIGESKFRPIANAAGSNYTGVFQGSKDIFKATDTERQCNYFLDGGQGFQAGGAIKLANEHQSYSYGTIAYLVEGDLSNFKGTKEAEHFYQKWSSEASEILQEWGQRVSSSNSTTKNADQPYAFARGMGGHKEDSWTAIQRLAKEVQWRAFMIANTLYYVSEEELFTFPPGGTIMPGAPGIIDLDFAMDTGKKVSQATLTARASLWGMPPGSVMTAKGYGPADGRWLITQTSRSIFSPSTSVTLKQPQLVLQEPATRDGSGGSSNVTVALRGGSVLSGGTARERVVAAAEAALKKASHFKYAQVRPLPRSLFQSGTIKTDCSGFAILCFKAAGVSDPNGTSYNGSGSTYTLRTKGKKVSSPKAGDLAFYEGPDHVSVYIGGGQCIEFGGDPMKKLPVTYRKVVEYRSYLP